MDCYDRRDWLIFTLKALIPNSYPKNNNKEVIESTINYMKELKEKLTRNEQEYQTININVKVGPQYSALGVEPANVIASFSGFEVESEIETVLKDLENYDNEIDDERQKEFRFDVECKTVDNILIQNFWTDGDSIETQEIILEEKGEERLEEEKYEEQLQEEKEKGEAKIKRPLNGFIRFSKAKRKEVSEKYPTYDNRRVSEILGCMWRKLPKQEKEIYANEFKKAMQERREKYPDWNYAASRAKTHRKKDPTVILTNRLRTRTDDIKTKLFAVESKMAVHKTKKISKAGKLKLKEELDLWAQCDLCGQWRKLPTKGTNQELSDYWDCSMNPNPLYNTCFVKEELEG